MTSLSAWRRVVAVLFVAVLAPAAGIAPASAAEERTDGAEPFDLQAHRGGIGLTVESTLAAFSRALRLGVSTLELDVQITEDGKAVVTHDRQVSGRKCEDTRPATPGDPEYPYVGKYVNTLTLAQVKTLDCGSTTLPEYPRQEADPGASMPTLREVFALVREYRAHGVMLNVETKVEAGAPSETAPRQQFVHVVAHEVRRARMLDQVTIQSFDWGALKRMSEVEPALPIVALTNHDFLEVDQPGKSPWLGGLDIDDFDDDLVAAAASFGADAISPVHGFPQSGRVDDPGYRPYVTRKMVRDAHSAGLDVVPWTVDDEPTMRSLMDKGVDGLITDYPDLLRSVMAERGMRLPRPYRAPRGSGPEPLAQAHAHNDYEHERPLFDALEHGFTSVEADVWLVDGELRVAHDRDQVTSRTLTSLYLDPLRRRVARHGGSVYPRWRGEFQLLIDIKSQAEPTYAAIDRALGDHAGMMTTYVGGKRVRSGAVTAVISGNRPLETMREQRVRRAGYDGRLSDLGSGMSRGLMPLVSDNWTSHFGWRGEGEMPARERAKLHDIVARAHERGYRVRFWATPDEPGAARRALWRELLDAGVDHINTDDLAGLQAFLRRSQDTEGAA
jgi:glycerophosphoryl diester phosphodiesterase